MRAREFVLFIAVLLLLGGCQPGGSDTPALNSRFFDHVEVIGGRGGGAGEFNKPRSLALDSHDNLFVVDITGRVQKFSPAGEFLLSWQMPQTDLGKPKGMGRDDKGNIVVVEPHYSRVNFYSDAGKLLYQWGVPGTNAGQLGMPRSVAITRHGEIYVSEYGHVERVQKFAADGKTLLARIGTAGAGPGEFNRAEGLGLDAQERLYVADSCNHRIQIFNPEGKFIASYGRAGQGMGELSYPYDIRVDAQGCQYVCEFGNSRVQVFDSLNQPVEILGGPGAAPGQMSNPWSIAFDSHWNLYVADGGNHRVLKFVRKAHVAKTAAGQCQVMKGRSHATKAEEGYRSPRRFASGVAPERPARVLECASPLSSLPAKRQTRHLAGLQKPQNLDVARASSPAGSGGVSPPVSDLRFATPTEEGSRTETVPKPAGEDARATGQAMPGLNPTIPPCLVGVFTGKDESPLALWLRAPNGRRGNHESVMASGTALWKGASL